MVESRTAIVELLGAAAREQHLRFDARRVCIVVAHPDDETIGCGALLWRLRGAMVVLVTDGAPRSLLDARACGFGTAQAYAERRASEWRSALALAEVPPPLQHMLGIPDQQAAFTLARLTRDLARIFTTHAIRVVLTHSYEGGHPDHDAVAFACHRAARISRNAYEPVTLVEMPFYRDEDGRFERQSFAQLDDACRRPLEYAVPVSGEHLARKTAMRNAYQSQSTTLAPFSLDCERFRLAPDYDFERPPNSGALLYERFDWGLHPSRWRELVASCAAPAVSDLRPC